MARKNRATTSNYILALIRLHELCGDVLIRRVVQAAWGPVIIIRVFNANGQEDNDVMFEYDINNDTLTQKHFNWDDGTWE